MAQTAKLVTILKAQLKAHGKTYIDVADALELTEASVKRLFSEQSFSLNRLDRVCRMLDMEISDLVQIMNESERRIERLSAEKEREITEDIVLMMVMVCVFNRWTVSDMMSYYTLTEEQCVSKLAQLDRLGIIELLPNNRIKLMIAPNFNWIEGGPIQRFFQETVGREFFDTSFQESGECLFVLNGMLGKQSAEIFQRKLDRLKQEFNELSNMDSGLDMDDRKGFTFVMAMRNWDYGLFRHMLRDVA